SPPGRSWTSRRPRISRTSTSRISTARTRTHPRKTNSADALAAGRADVSSLTLTAAGGPCSHRLDGERLAGDRTQAREDACGRRSCGGRSARARECERPVGGAPVGVLQGRVPRLGPVHGRRLGELQYELVLLQRTDPP